MNRVLGASACLVFAAAACGDDAPSHGNPPILWLALDGSETRVRLVANEPTPF